MVVDCKPTTQCFLILLDTGKLMGINRMGQCVVELIHPKSRFTSLSLFYDLIYLGTATGDVNIYSVNSYSLVRDINTGHRTPINNVAVSRGNLVYAFYADSTTRIFSIPNS